MLKDLPHLDVPDTAENAAGRGRGGVEDFRRGDHPSPGDLPDAGGEGPPLPLASGGGSAPPGAAELASWQDAPRQPPPWELPEWCLAQAQLRSELEPPPTLPGKPPPDKRAALLAAAELAAHTGLTSPGVPLPPPAPAATLEQVLARPGKLGKLGKLAMTVLASSADTPPPPSPPLPPSAAKLSPELERVHALGMQLAGVDPVPLPFEYEPPKPPPPKLTPGERRKVALAKQEARRQKRRNAYIEKMKAKGIPEDACPPDCPPALYELAQTILKDFSSRRTIGILEEEARDRSGFHLGLLRDVLGGKLDLRKYEDRELVAAWVLLYRVATRTQRKGGWVFCVRGYSLAWLAGVLHRPGRPESRRDRSQLGGGGRRTKEHRELARAQRWGEGYTPRRRGVNKPPLLQRLRDGGVLYAQQLAWKDAEPWERDTRGEHDPEHAHTRNRYWLQGLSLDTQSRRRVGKSSPELAARGVLARAELDLEVARVQALEAYGQEWVTLLRNALERRAERQTAIATPPD